MRFVNMRAAVAALLSLCLLAISAPAWAGSIVRDDFVFPERGDVKIVVFRPDVHVGSLKIGGLDEPNAEWTEEARANIQASLEAEAAARSSNMIFIDDLEGENAVLLNNYRGLFEAVSGAMFQHLTLGDKLPTKLTKETTSSGRTREVVKLDWTLGEGASQLRDVTGADYAMFVFTHDAYGDAGRKVAQVLMAGLFGAYVPAGVHIGYAGLVDLRTGNIVWFNTDLQMGGDPRNPEGAEKRVGQLMRGFPDRQEQVGSEASD